jgi:serine protease
MGSNRVILSKKIRHLTIFGIFCVWALCACLYASEEAQKYIVVYKGHTEKRAMLKKTGFAPTRSFNIIPAVVANLSSERVKSLREDSRIAFIEPDYRVYATDMTSLDGAVTSSDADSQSLPYGIEMIAADQVWPMTKGAGAVVAVLDTGISLYHPDRGNVILTESFVTDEAVEDFNGHGTHTAGTIAAVDNEIGVVGVVPEVDLIIGKVLDDAGEGYTSQLIDGIEWAVANGADVISMSLGGEDNSTALETACDNAYNSGVLLVAAAGNDGSALPNYPAAYDSVVSVAAIDESKQIAYFSNYGSTIELSAPGVSVLSTVPVYREESDAVGDAAWSNTSHESNIIKGTAAGSIDGLICDCGLATGLNSENSCPEAVAGNIAFIRRGDITFVEKVAHAESMGAAGVIIANNVSGNFYGTLAAGSPLVVVSISGEDGDELESLAESGITGTVSVTASLYNYHDGTSMATPHIAGAAALMIAAQGGAISAADVRGLLADTAEDLGDLGRDNYYGYGLIDLSAAFATMEPLTCDAAWTLGYGYPADIDMNCYVGLSDLNQLATEWLSSNCSSDNDWCDGADIDQSNSVSLMDFQKLAIMWLDCNDPQDIACTPNWP